MSRPLPGLLALGALAALAACAGPRPLPSGAPASAAAPPVRMDIPAEPASATAGLTDTTIGACRAEAERATVQQNRGELMRLDESENRGRDSLLQNQQERGLLITTRDRLFRDCLVRARARAQAEAAAQPAGQPPAPR